ncbi:unnamed protein product [Phyllotreta striolata]|uniref:Uncharacterized protein n=1 Tax=Phyllotreta striolata TaxID=444603 RepID=A0A9P0E0J4_PHYSR|nr:unnamed protein product [Phyllotreta striolata]
MEEGLNNANNPNPFGCANGSPAAKTEGGLHKQNGLAQEQMFEKSNGKRLASEFDEQDDDFGPETDVDAVDDVIPVTTGTKCEVPKSFAECFDPISNYSGFEEEGVCNPFVEHQEKASAEMQKVKKKVEFQEDEEREAREETPTPPADAVHDASGLVDSESEDEWNYFKGGEADKENVSPQLEKEVADIAEEDDTMSQLNPNAAEFVPVSPTRNVASPPSCIRGLNEAIISESPKKAIDIDISLPNVRDFEKEVKSRPGDINLSDGSISKSSTSDSSSSNVYRSFEDLPTICSSRDNPSKDLMENILNGKNIDEIPEFQPNSDSPKKVFQTDEFHFGPKALPFINKPNEQDDSSTADSCASIDPATASPDLNKLHDIPDDLEKFLESDNDISNDTSDRGASREPHKDNDAFKLSSNFDNEKELASPLESERDALKSDEPKLLPNIDFLNVSSEDRPNDVARDLLNSVESESICCSNESNTVESSRDSYDVLSKSPAPLESDYTRPEALELARQSFEELCSAEPPPRDLQRETSVDATPAELIREADARFEELCKPLESPLEEVTSSVKDDLSEGTGDNDNGDVRLIDTDDRLVADVAPEPEPIIAENEPTKVENLVELPKEEVNVMVPSIEHDEDESLLKSCDIKTEPILEPTVVAPEAPKIDDTPETSSKNTKLIIPPQTTVASIILNNLEIPLAGSSSAQAAFRREIIGTSDINKSFGSLVPRDRDSALISTIILNSSDVNNLYTNAIPRLLTESFKLFVPNATRLTLSMGKENKIPEIVASSSEIKIEDEFNLPESIEENDYQPFYDYSHLFPASEALVLDGDLYAINDEESLSPEENRIVALKQLLQQVIRTEERPQSSIESSSTPADETDNSHVNAASDCKNCGDRLNSTILVSKGICINPEMHCHMENMQSVVSETDLLDYQRTADEYGFVRWPSTIEEKGIFVEPTSRNEDASDNRADEKIQSKSVHFVDVDGASNAELGYTLEDNDCSSNSDIFPNRSASGDRFDSVASDKSELAEVEYAKSLMNQLIDTISANLQDNKLKTSNTLMVYMLRSGIEKLKQTKSLPDSFSNKKKRKQPVSDCVETNEDNQDTVKSSMSDSFRPVCDYSFLPSTSNNDGNIVIPAPEKNDIDATDESRIGRGSSVVPTGLDRLEKPLADDATDKSITVSNRVEKVVNFDDNTAPFERSTRVSSAVGAVQGVIDCDYSLVPRIEDSDLPRPVMKVDGALDCDFSLVPSVDYDSNSASCPIVNLGKVKDDYSAFDVPDSEYYPSAPLDDGVKPLQNDFSKFKTFSPSADVREFISKGPDCDYSLIPFIDDTKITPVNAVENDVRATTYDCDYSLIPSVDGAKISGNSSQVIENVQPFVLFPKNENIAPPANKKYKYFGSPSFPSIGVEQVDDSTSILLLAGKVPLDVRENVSLADTRQPVCDNSFVPPTNKIKDLSSLDEHRPVCDYSFALPSDEKDDLSSLDGFGLICDYSFALPTEEKENSSLDEYQPICDYSFALPTEEKNNSPPEEYVPVCDYSYQLPFELIHTTSSSEVYQPICDYSFALPTEEKNTSPPEEYVPVCDYSYHLPFELIYTTSSNEVYHPVCDYSFSLPTTCSSIPAVDIRDQPDCDYSLTPIVASDAPKSVENELVIKRVASFTEIREPVGNQPVPVVDSKATASKVRKGAVQFRDDSPAVEVEKPPIPIVEFSEIVSLVFNMSDGVARVMGDADNVPSLVGNFYSPVCDYSFTLPGDNEDVTFKYDDFEPVCDYSFSLPTDNDETSMKSTDDYKPVCDHHSFSLPLSLPFTDFRNYSLDIDNPTYEKYQPVFDYSFSYPVDDTAVNDSPTVCDSFSFILDDDPLSNKRDLSLCYTDFRNYSLDCNNPTFERYQPVYDYSFCHPVDDAIVVSDSSKPVRDSLYSITTDDNVDDRDNFPSGFTDSGNYSLDIDNPTFEKHQPVLDHSIKPICGSAFSFPVENEADVSPAIDRNQSFGLCDDRKPSSSLPIEHGVAQNDSPVIEECEFVNNQSIALPTYGIVASSIDNVREVPCSLPNDIDGISLVIEDYMMPIKASEDVLSLTDMYQPVCDYSFALPGEEREDLSQSVDGYLPVCDYSYALPGESMEDLSQPDSYRPVCDYSYALPGESMEDLSQPDSYRPVCDYSYALPGESKEDLSQPDSYRPVCDYSFALPGESKEDLSQSPDDYWPVCDYSFALDTADSKKVDGVEKVASVEDSLKSVGDYIGFTMLVDDCSSISFVEIGKTVSVMIDKVDEEIGYEPVSSRDEAGKERTVGFTKEADSFAPPISKVYSNGEEIESSVIASVEVSKDKIAKESRNREMASSLADNLLDGIESALGNIGKDASGLVDAFKTNDATKSVEKVIEISEKPSKMSLFEDIPDLPVHLEDTFRPVCDYSFALPVDETAKSDPPDYRPVCDYSFALSTSPMPDDRAVWASGAFRPVCDYSFVLSTVDENDDALDASIDAYLPACDYSFALPVKGGDETVKKLIKNYRRTCNIAHATSAKETKRSPGTASDRPICDYFYVPSVCDHRLQTNADEPRSTCDRSSGRSNRKVDGSKRTGRNDDDTGKNDAAKRVESTKICVEKPGAVSKSEDAPVEDTNDPVEESPDSHLIENNSDQSYREYIDHLSDTDIELNFSASDTDYYQSVFDDTYREIAIDDKYQPVCDYSYDLPNDEHDERVQRDDHQPTFDNLDEQITVELSPSKTKSTSATEAKRPALAGDLISTVKKEFDVRKREEFRSVDSIGMSKGNAIEADGKKAPNRWQERSLDSTEMKEGLLAVTEFQNIDSLVLPFTVEDNRPPNAPLSPDQFVVNFRKILASTLVSALSNFKNEFSQEMKKIDGDSTATAMARVFDNIHKNGTHLSNVVEWLVCKAFLDSQTTNTNDAQKLLSELESEMTAIGITSTVAAGAALTAVLTEKERPAPAADVPQEAEKEPLEEHQDNQQKEPEPKEEEAPKTKPVTSKTAAAAAAVAAPKASKTAVKAPLSKTAASATNRLASKTSVASKASGTVKAASKSTLAAKPTARSAPVKTADKVLNGEAKPSARLTSARRPVETASKPKLPAQTATSKPNVTKAPTKKLEPTAVKTTKSVEMKQRTVAKKPLDKPNTAVSAATKVSNATKAPSSGVATKPKPSTLTAPPKPRVPLTKTVAKTDAPKADAQKQNKENVNKLMASRTATKPASSNAKKVETKDNLKKQFLQSHTRLW